MPTLADVEFVPMSIVDSRGRPTVRVHARCGAHEGFGDVPAGASKGRDEAHTVPHAAALANVPVLAAALRQVAGDLTAPATLLAADAAIAAAAGAQCKRLGANATVPVSRSLWALAASVAGKACWQLLREASGLTARRPDAPPFGLFNVFNGGLHALRPGEVLGRDRIEVQEIMVVPTTRVPADSLRVADAIDRSLMRRLCAVFGAAQVDRGDEAGLSVAGLGDSVAAVGHVVAAIEAAGFAPGVDVKLALDVAAGSFADQAGYRLGGQVLCGQQMVAWIGALCDRFDGMLASVEDGLHEDDWAAWPSLQQALGARGIRVVGDDLFVTQSTRLAQGIAAGAADTILLKVNQNGTVGGTLAVAAEARRAGMAAIVSHRSGETLDDSIADLAYAIGAFGLKAGAPQPVDSFADPASWVRRGKYLRLAELAVSA